MKTFLANTVMMFSVLWAVAQPAPVAGGPPAAAKPVPRVIAVSTNDSLKLGGPVLVTVTNLSTLLEDGRVAGDFNDTPDRPPLASLLQTPNLFDVLASNKLAGPRWTYQTANEQIDYLLVSKALYARLEKVGIERRGIFHPTNFKGQFPHFPEVKNKTAQASDHAAVWAEFKI